MSMMTKRCTACGTRIGWIALLVDSGLMALKLAVGLQTGSRAMMADALYSLVDVISALLVLSSFKLSRKGVDENHPYGHGKVEFLAIATVSLCIAAFAVLLLHRVAEDLVRGGHPGVSPLAAATAGLSVVACLLVYGYARCVGTSLNSPILITHAEHHKADAISSVAVLVSIVLSWVGLGLLDPLVAGLEIVHIIGISYVLLRRGMHGLLDASVDPSQRARIIEIATRVPGVAGVHDVRARHIGASIWIELTVRVGPCRRMAEAGRIRAQVRAELMSGIDHIANVMIRVLPTAAPDGKALVPLRPLGHTGGTDG